MNSVGIIKWIRIKIKRSEQRENIRGIIQMERKEDMVKLLMSV